MQPVLCMPAPSPRLPADIGDWTYCFDVSHLYCKAARCCNIMLDHVQFLIGEIDRVPSCPGNSCVPGKRYSAQSFFSSQS